MRCCCFDAYVIRGRDLIKKVVETYSETNPARRCSESASILIAFCGKSDLPGFRDGKMRTKFDSWYMFDMGIALQNMQLAAHDIGLGSVVVGSMDHNRCAELLNVTPPYELIGILPVGKPVDMKKEGPSRRETSEFTHMERFGNRKQS